MEDQEKKENPESKEESKTEKFPVCNAEHRNFLGGLCGYCGMRQGHPSEHTCGTCGKGF